MDSWRSLDRVDKMDNVGHIRSYIFPKKEPMVSAQPSLQQSAKPHLHVQGEQCPLCEQPIPQEKSKEITQRIAAKERRQQAEIDARILREKAEAEAKAKFEIETMRQQGLAAVEAAKAEAATREATVEKRARGSQKLRCRQRSPKPRKPQRRQMSWEPV